VICAKGIEQSTGALMGEVVAEVAPAHAMAVLSGPTFAHEVARGLPTGITLACADAALGQTLVAALGQPMFRPYYSQDVMGAEIGGAVKNVLAIACGIAAGRGLGENAKATLITRGLAEMLRFGAAKNAQAQTLMGLCGLGDLILTCGSAQSRNMSLGIQLGQGMSATDALSGKRTVAEGAATAPVLARLATAHGVDMPICQAVHEILQGADVSAAITGLLARPYRSEL
jgi:glycerol-3-phosphate dehydrogenase (NAD(P)+)